MHLRMLKFAFYFFDRNGLEWANTMVHVLQVLFASQTWRRLLEAHLSQCVERLGSCDQPPLSALLSLFVVTGFPEVHITLLAMTYNVLSRVRAHECVVAGAVGRLECAFRGQRRRAAFGSRSQTFPR